ncbi:hypothetical protein Cflav_PD6010 [Pedosphaera parvula Ellin514]|uniref:SMP domain-containing protein n=1 Tax=Pedosphaera parvula (strain Ellin514) TaxID=320771 RepID=B9XA34_PEDPL|nr:hypothetical protein Cflav_PD6010 [Pedosphaera parvula Ellin514]
MSKGNSGNSGSKCGTPMTSQAASRIQSATAKSNGGQVPSGSFASRAQSSVAKSSGQSGNGGK